MNDDNNTTELSPADAFEELRKEIAMNTRTLRDLSAERAKAPDHRPILEKMREVINQHSKTLNHAADVIEGHGARVAALANAPALKLTAHDWAYELSTAAVAARQKDQVELQSAKASFAKAYEELCSAIVAVFDARKHRYQLGVAALSGFSLAALLFFGVAWMNQNPTSVIQSREIAQPQTSLPRAAQPNETSVHQDQPRTTVVKDGHHAHVRRLRGARPTPSQSQ